MDNYPSTDEIMSEISQEAQPANPSAADQQASAPVETKPAEPQFLDLDKYKAHHVTYKARGKEIKEPLEKVLARASQGYDYAQLVDGHKKSVADWEKERNELAKYKQYNDFAKANPDWAKHVEESWNTRGNPSPREQDPNDPYSEKFAKLEERFNQFGERFSKYDEYIQGQTNAKDDKLLDDRITEIRAKYKQIDLDQSDDEGRSNEFKVLEHMKKTGIQDFEVALKDLFFDDLMASAKSQALSNQVNDKQKAAKQGIVGVSSAPQFSKPQASGSVREKSWEQLAEMARQELSRQA